MGLLAGVCWEGGRLGYSNHTGLFGLFNTALKFQPVILLPLKITEIPPASEPTATNPSRKTSYAGEDTQSGIFCHHY